MAITNSLIAEIINQAGQKEVGQLTAKYVAENNRLVKSGLIVADESVQTLATGTDTGTIHFIKGITPDTVNVGSEDINDEGDVGKLIGGSYNAIRHSLNYAIGSTDLVKMSTNFSHDPLVQELFGEYQLGIDEKVMINSALGASLATGATALTKERNNGDSILKSAYLGVDDANGQEDFDTLIVNRANFAQMRVDNMNAFVPASQTESRYAEYAGFKVIVSEAFGANLVVLKRGCFAGAHVNPHGAVVPFEIERKANGANGMGGTIYHTRWALAMHVQGFSWVGANTKPAVLSVSTSATDSLRRGANWTLVADVADIGFRILTPYTA